MFQIGICIDPIFGIVKIIQTGGICQFCGLVVHMFEPQCCSFRKLLRSLKFCHCVQFTCIHDMPLSRYQRVLHCIFVFSMSTQCHSCSATIQKTDNYDIIFDFILKIFKPSINKYSFLLNSVEICSLCVFIILQLLLFLCIQSTKFTYVFIYCPMTIIVNKYHYFILAIYFLCRPYILITFQHVI